MPAARGPSALAAGHDLGPKSRCGRGTAWRGQRRARPTRGRARGRDRLSGGETRATTSPKAREYLVYGLREYWIVDLATRRVTVLNCATETSGGSASTAVTSRSRASSCRAGVAGGGALVGRRGRRRGGGRCGRLGFGRSGSVSRFHHHDPNRVTRPMASRPFVHLHCHSHYSLLDGASQVPDLGQTGQSARHAGRSR